MKQVLATSGGVVVEDVPAPLVEPGTVLVSVEYSCISVGTELAGVHHAETPLWRKAVQDPAKVRRVVEMLAKDGVARTREVVRGKANLGTPLGYSVAGVVTAVGPDVVDLTVGDRVACAGAGVANHAEVVRVPRNLVVRVPDMVSSADASTVTLGAIALQGVRRAAPTLGETFVVVGLGVLGQLTVQLLKANGCRVIVTDLSAERIELASRMGADLAVHSETGDAVDQAMRLTDGVGADGVIITAATPSDEVVSTAFRFCRRKGRVVLVGDVGLNLRRADFYAKELDFLISTSYGPGRYDRTYEEEGLDYPIGYVRWTENRNMVEVLHLMQAGRLSIEPLVGLVSAVDDAPQAYAALQDPEARPLIALLRYDRPWDQRTNRVRAFSSTVARSGRVRIAVVGAGAFAQGMHLPNLKRNDRFELRSIVGRTGHAAAALATQYDAAYATTEFERVLNDEDVDAVLIATRHDSHARMTLEALRAGKHVLVEKPLSLTRGELEEIEAFYRAAGESDRPILLTGFNRRFSPFAVAIRERLASGGPVIMDYRMNAGHIPADHWVHGPQGGGRNLGEACHIYDLFTYLTGEQVTQVTASALRPKSGYYRSDDNFVMTAGFADGSVGTLTYTALGSTQHPKERLDTYVGGDVLSLEDYLDLRSAAGKRSLVERKQQDKGHRAELEAFAAAVLDGGPWPIPLWQQLQASDIAFQVQDAITTET